MANTKSARKAIRRTVRRTDVNRRHLSSLRTSVKKVEQAIESGDKAAAQAALKAAEPVVMGGVSKGVIHRNTASRKISRLTRNVNALS